MVTSAGRLRRELINPQEVVMLWNILLSMHRRYAFLLSFLCQEGSSGHVLDQLKKRPPHGGQTTLTPRLAERSSATRIVSNSF